MYWWGRFSGPLGSESTASGGLPARPQAGFPGVPAPQLPPLQAVDAELHFLQPLDLPERAGKLRCPRVSSCVQVLALETVLGGSLEDLQDPVAGDRRPPAQPAHLRPLRLRLLGQRTNSAWRVASGDRSKP